MEKSITELEAIVQSAASEQERIDALNALSGRLRATDAQRAIEYAQDARKRASTGEFADQPYQKGIAESFFNLGQASVQLAKYESALSFLLGALRHHQEMGDSKGEARTQHTIGGLHYNLGNYTDTLERELEALQIADQIDDQDLFAAATIVIGRVYSQLDDPKTALSHFQTSLAIFQKTGNKSGEADTLGDLAATQIKLGDHDSALGYGQKCLELYQELGNREGETQALESLGAVYAALDDSQNARACYDRCLTLARETGNRRLETQALLAIGKLLQSQDGQQALVLFKQALAGAEGVQSRQQIFAIHQALAQAYKQDGDYQNALLHYEQFHAEKEKATNDTAERQLNELRVLYQIDAAEKEAEIYHLKNIALEKEIARRTGAETELNERLNQLRTVLQVYDEVSSTLSVDSVQMIALDAAVRLSGASGGFIAMDEDGAVQIAKTIGHYPLPDYRAILNPDGATLKHVKETRKSEITTEIDPANETLPLLPGTTTRIVIPMISQDRFLGLVNLETDKPERFNHNVFQLLQILERYISVALDNARLYHQVQQQLLELIKVNQQVTQLEQLKTDMIRVAAHDLRNPLSVIFMNLKLLDFGRDQMAPEQRDYLDSIQAATRRMSKLVDDILSLERIEQMTRIELAEVVDLAAQVKKAADEYREQAAQKSQTLTTDIPPEGGLRVKGDESQLYEALSNLIGNAIKYTPDQGSISLSLKSEAEKVIFEVTDTGYGIPDDLQARLFQPFYQAKTKETAGIEGTGLGLHLVKNIIDRHGGEMIFRSVHGEGSTFGFSLPKS